MAIFHCVSFRLISLLGLLAALLTTYSGGVFAASAGSADAVIEEVVVTGSFIKGTPIDSASPVTVIDREGLLRQGSPSVVEMVRRITASSGVDGETNQFQSNQSEGVASVNIRGLGAHRTLVLMNGRRQTPVPARLPGGRFVDINAIPRAALGRVEVLKEGAAATYGSDAIGGVVNFLTRDDFQGFEVSLGHQNIADSDGNNEFGAIFGTQLGRFDWVTSVGFERRNELSLRDRDFSQVPFDTNPQGGFSTIGNPGVLFRPAAVPSAIAAGNIFFALSPTFGGTPDPNCAALGGVRNSLFCRFRYTDFDNLIEQEDRYQLFSELNGEVADDVRLHLEFWYAKANVPEYKTSPSYPPQALFGDIQYLPADHPGLVAMAAQYPDYEQYIAEQMDADGNVVPGTGEGATFYGRIAGVTGFLNSGSGRVAKREYDSYRLVAALDGELDNGVGWDMGLTYARSLGELEQVDARIGRTKLAFRGFGGEGCGATLDTSGDLVTNGAVAGQGGCEYYNPLSNAIQTSYAEATYGYQNPDYDPAVANSQALLQWLDDKSTENAESALLVLDAVFQGELFEGEGAWASGYQYRKIWLESELDDLTNVDRNPCAFEGQRECDARTGLRSFLASGREVDASQAVHSIFFEAALDVNENLDLQLAARYEDYGDANTFDPKVGGRYRISDALTVRASVQTTFRAPNLDETNESRVTSLSFVGPTAAFKAIDNIGNADLEPESAFTYNVGFILNPVGNMTLTLDYWNYDFDNPIDTESYNALVAAYGGTPEQKAAVQAQIFCTGTGNDGSCGTSGIERIEVQVVNGPSLSTAGIDIFAEYDLLLANGAASFGLDLSHTLHYKQDAYYRDGIEIEPSYDAAGFLNVNRTARSLPDLKARLFGEYSLGAHNLLAYINYVTSYEDERPDIDAEVDAQTTLDLHYQYSFMEDNALFTLSAVNVTDEDPPLARVDLNYDAYTHNGFGRMIKLGLQYRM